MRALRNRATGRTTSRIGAIVLLACSGACTTFYGLKPDATSSSSGTGAGGAGGAHAEGLLLKLDAAHLCALVASCPTLGASIVASVGLPVVETGAATDVRNFSACVDWLTLPMSAPKGSSATPARIGFDLVRSMTVCMAASTSCDDAERCAFAEVIGPGDPRCAGGKSGCDATGDFVDCTLYESFGCKSELFAPDSSCSTAQSVSSCANGLCSAAEDQCGGGYFFSCAGAMQSKQSLNCAVYGLSCDDSAATPSARGCFGQTGLATCNPNALGQESCSGTRVRVCSGAVSAEVDCSALGEVCVTDAGTPGPARCKRPDALCSPYDATSNVCSGSTISVCLDGVKDTIDCSAIGLACVPASGPLSAHCG